MSEKFNSQEYQRYLETHQNYEYNHINQDDSYAELFKSYEFNSNNDEKISTIKNEKKNVQKNLIISNAFSIVYAAATIIVTVTTITLIAVKEIVIHVLSSDITSYSLQVDFQIENIESHILTAELTNGIKVYDFTIENSTSNVEVYFDHLVPDMNYTLSISDEEGKLYFTNDYQTLAYEPKILPVEKGGRGDSLLLQFDDKDIGDKVFDVYVNGILQTETISESASYIIIENLLANTPYDVRVVNPINGEWVYSEIMTTGDLLYYYPQYINANEISIRFDDEVLIANNIDYELEVYFNNILQNEKLNIDNLVYTFSDLEKTTEYDIQVYDPVNNIYLMKNKITTSDITIERWDVNVSVDYVSIYPRFVSSDIQEIRITLKKDNQFVDEYLLTTIKNDGSLVEDSEVYFENLESGTEYALEIMNLKNGDIIYYTVFTTANYFQIQNVVEETYTETGESLAVLKRIDDAASDLNYALFTLPANTNIADVGFECISDNGYTLPLFNNMRRTYSYSVSVEYEYELYIMTQYAKSNEIYELQMYAFDQNMNKQIIDSVAITIEDDTNVVEYPTFDINIAYTEDGAMQLEIEHLDGNLLVNENNEAIYYLDSDILVENYIQSSDFSSIPLQSYEIIEIEVSANYEIEIIFDDGYGQYTIYKGIVSI